MVEKDNLQGIKQLFGTCVKDAIKIGRKYMKNKIIEEEKDFPTKEEWNLALALFQKRLG